MNHPLDNKFKVSYILKKLYVWVEKQSTHSRCHDSTSRYKLNVYFKGLWAFPTKMQNGGDIKYRCLLLRPTREDCEAWSPPKPPTGELAEKLLRRGICKWEYITSYFSMICANNNHKNDPDELTAHVDVQSSYVLVSHTLQPCFASIPYTVSICRNTVLPLVIPHVSKYYNIHTVVSVNIEENSLWAVQGE